MKAKKLWAALMALVMAISLLPAAAFATDMTADQLQKALNQAAKSENKTVTLTSNVTVSDKDHTGGNGSSIISIPAGVTLDGGGCSIIADGWKSSNKYHVVGVSNAAVGTTTTIQNLKITGTASTKSGIHAYQCKGTVVLDGVIISDCGNAAVQVNGSVVNATGLETSDNAWGAVNVDQGSKFTMDQTSVLTENVQVWSEDYGKDNGSTVSVAGYQTVVGGVARDGVLKGYTYFTTDVTRLGEATIVKDDTTHVYKDLAQAVEQAAKDDTIKLLKEITVNASNASRISAGQGAINISKSITLDGNGKTITAGTGFAMNTDGTRGEYHVINVYSGANVVIRNLIVDGAKTATNAARSGINVYNASADLFNVEVKNCSTYGVTVGSSTVKAQLLKTENNGWGGVNVDTKVDSVNSKFTMESGVISEENSVYVENVKNLQSSAAISYGIFEGRVHVAENAGEGGKLTVSGGVFSEPVAKEYLASGLKYQLESDGKYTYHEKVEDAIAAAKPGDTVISVDNADATEFYTVEVYNESLKLRDDQVQKNGSYKLPGAYIKQGYEFKGWQSSVNGVVYPANAFVQINSNTTFTAVYEIIVAPVPGHAISVVTDGNGTVTTTPVRAEAGETVTINVTPNAGYEVADITVTTVTGEAIAVSGNRFTMPNASVTVKVTFVKTAASNPFTDVNTGNWFYDEVMWAYENGVMDGIGGGKFGPNNSVSRAMVWTVLARLDNKTISGSNWAEEACAWAMAEGVSDGTMATGNVTREQLATMLYRYAKSQGIDVSIGEDTNILSYSDAAQVSDWAVEAMQWACGTGIINGMDGKLNPQGGATRAQLAAMLMRFVEDVA